MTRPLRVKFRITGFLVDPMKIMIFLEIALPTAVAALLTHERDRERHSGRVVKLRLDLRAQAFTS